MNKAKSALAALALGAAFTGAAHAQHRDFTKADACVGELIQQRVEEGKLTGQKLVYMNEAEFGDMKARCEGMTGTQSAYYKDRRDMTVAVPPPREYAPY